MDQGKQGVNGRTCLPIEDGEASRSAGADLAGLDPVGEGAAVDQALGVDTREARSLDADAGVAVAAPRAAILNGGAARLAGDDLVLAADSLMLELDEDGRIAQADRAGLAVRAAKLPAPALELRQGFHVGKC